MINGHGYDQYEEMKKWVAIWHEEAAKFYEDGNKAAAARARKALLQVCKARTAWNKATIHGEG